MNTYLVTLYDLSQFEVHAFTIHGALITAEQHACTKDLEVIKIERVMGV